MALKLQLCSTHNMQLLKTRQSIIVTKIKKENCFLYNVIYFIFSNCLCSVLPSDLATIEMDNKAKIGVKPYIKIKSHFQ